MNKVGQKISCFEEEKRSTMSRNGRKRKLEDTKQKQKSQSQKQKSQINKHQRNCTISTTKAGEIAKNYRERKNN